MLKSKAVSVFFAIACFTLLFLLLRENEGRTAAEEKLRDMQFTLDSMKNDKANAVTGFEADILELQRQLQDAAVQYAVLAHSKEAQIEALKAEKEQMILAHNEALVQKTEEIGGLESRMKEEALKYEGLLEEKNAEMNELAAQLEQISAKLASAVKKAQALESGKISLEKRVAALEAEVQTLARQKARLAELVKTAQTEKAPAD